MRHIAIILWFCVWLALRVVGQPTDFARWDNRFAAPGFNNRVYAMVFQGSNIYAGGWFTSVGRVPADGLAWFNGEKWQPIPNGPTMPQPLINIFTIQMFQNRLYAGGFFTNLVDAPVGGLVAWDGTNWFIPGITNGRVLALKTNSAGLLVGGSFTMPGTTNLSVLARWDGTTWTNLSSELAICNGGSGFCYSEVDYLEAIGSNVFTLIMNSSSFPQLVLRQCDASNHWSNLKSLGALNAIATYQNCLVAGGSFTNLGNSNLQNVALWDGANWQALGAGLPGSVYCMASHENHLYAYHKIPSTPPPTLYAVSQFDGTNWSQVGTNYLETDDPSPMFCDPSGQVYCCGNYVRAGEVHSSGLLVWNGTNWSPLLQGQYEGISGYFFLVRTFVKHQGDVYIAGSFNYANSRPVQGIGRWTGTNWSDIGGKVSGFPVRSVYTMLSSGATLYAGGSFTNVNGLYVNNIASWDGTNWNGLGAGLGYRVNALTEWNGVVVAGGSFTNSGSQALKNIAQWDGNQWQPLGAGCSDSVKSLVVYNSELYAGGYFTKAGGVSASRIARWDGANWRDVGGGVTGGMDSTNVTCLVVGPDGLYVAGDFTRAGGIAATNIARWDGTNWFAVGNTLRGDIYTLAVRSNIVFAGGQMTDELGQFSGGIYSWDGLSWKPLGEGVSGSRVTALLPTDQEIFVGGYFNSAGGHPSINVARWIENPQPYLQTTFSGTQSSLRLQASADPGMNYQLQSSTNLRNWITLREPTNGTTTVEVTNLNASGQGFYRTVTVTNQ